MSRLLHLLAGSAALATIAATSAAAFQLDDRFVDNDGDLIADIPTDVSQQVDPSTLIFAYTPVEDPAVYREACRRFGVDPAEFAEHFATIPEADFVSESATEPPLDDKAEVAGGLNDLLRQHVAHVHGCCHFSRGLCAA